MAYQECGNSYRQVYFLDLIRILYSLLNHNINLFTFNVIIFSIFNKITFIMVIYYNN